MRRPPAPPAPPALQLFAGEQPWAGLDKREVKRLVMEGKRPPEVPEMLKDRGTHLVKLYDGCLSKDSEKRPSLEHVVRELSANSASTSASWDALGEGILRESNYGVDQPR